jgi:hypothetical protein
VGILEEKDKLRRQKRVGVAGDPHAFASSLELKGN